MKFVGYMQDTTLKDMDQIASKVRLKHQGD